MISGAIRIGLCGWKVRGSHDDALWLYEAIGQLMLVCDMHEIISQFLKILGLGQCPDREYHGLSFRNTQRAEYPCAFPGRWPSLIKGQHDA